MSRCLTSNCGRLRAAKNTKQTTTGTTTSNNTFGTVNKLDDPRFAQAVESLGKFQFEHNPAIPFMYGNARNKLESSYNNPTGGYTNPQIRDAQIRSGSRALAQDESQAMREENYGFQGAKYGQLYDQASLKAPNIVQTGGKTDTTGTTTLSKPFDFNSIIQGGAGIGSALLM